VVREAIARRRHLEPLVALLASFEGGELVPELRLLADDPDPAVAEAAREALLLFDPGASETG